jgi:hypothetical protein
MTAGFGGVPSNVILPAMLPAVSAFTGLTVGAGVAGAVLSGPPPHPDATAASTMSPNLRRGNAWPTKLEERSRVRSAI